MHLGIVNLTLFCSALGGLGTVGGLVMEDKKVTLGDLRYAPQALSAAKKLAGVDYAAAPKEALDIEGTEREQLAKLFSDTFDLPAGLDSTEKVIETGMGFVLVALETVSTFLHHDTVKATAMLEALKAKNVPVKGLAAAA